MKLSLLSLKGWLKKSENKNDGHPCDEINRKNITAYHLPLCVTTKPYSMSDQTQTWPVFFCIFISSGI